MLGVIVNVAAVLLGGGIGLLFCGRIKEKYSDAVLTAIALAVLVIGILSAVGTQNVLCLVICVVLGTLIGEWLRIEDGVTALGKYAESRLSDGSDGKFTQGFVSCTILFCVGSMTIMGSIQSGLNGNHSILFVKSALDFVSSIVYASVMGVGVMAAAASVLLIQGTIALLAGTVAPLMTEAVVAEITAVGGTLIIGMAIDLLGLGQKKIKVANMLPGIFLPIIFIPLAEWVGSLIT